MIEIRTIEDVLPHIKPDTGIVVSERDRYTVIDYVYATEETFTNPMELECRGLKFSKDGKLIARPFHKFFNLFERQSIEDIDWSRPYIVLDKLDGSMIHPCVVDGEIVFMTRGGISRQAKEALGHASDHVMSLCEEMVSSDITPIFEYTGPDNRIIVEYHNPEITLLAARHLHSGHYLNASEVRMIADRHDVPCVREISNSGNSGDEVSKFYRNAVSLEGIEGYVICFDDGHRLKIKTSSYALRHKALSDFGSEKQVLRWVMEDATDDIHPLLSKENSDSLRTYEKSVRSGITAKLAELQSFYERHKHLERRDYAELVKKEADPRFRQVAFALMDGKEGLPFFDRLFIKASHNSERIENLRDVIGMSWDVDGPAGID